MSFTKNYYNQNPYIVYTTLLRIMKRNFRTGILLLALGLSYGGAIAQTPEERAWIVKHYDQDKAKELIDLFEARYKKEKEEAMALAVVNGWPLTITEKDGTYKALKKVIDGKPAYVKTFNAGAAQTTKVNAINTGGAAGLNLDGQGMIVGEWDGGPVRRSHVDLTIFRVTQKDGATGTADNHATHVAGTMISSGVNDISAKGMASQATLWANDWFNDLSEMANQANQGLLVSNHSYGLDANVLQAWRFGAYDSESAAWDNLTFNFPYYQPVVAAGNDRNALPANYPSSKSGRELIYEQATSKNVIVVAAVTGPNPITMSAFSNWGPTDDKRIKPDISAKGVSVYSTWGTGNNDYNAINGTSMAAPGISGALILLQQHYKNTHNNTFMRSATLRGVMNHTATDVGNLGPDHQYGWGVMNAQEGAAVIGGDGISSLILESALTAAAPSYTTEVEADGVNPLKVTLSWTDSAGNPNTGTNDLLTPVLVNDLDVRVVRQSNTTTYMPWRLNSLSVLGAPQRADNTVDNVEKIEILNAAGNAIEIPTAGERFTITVSHKGNLSGGTQQYSLIVSGINAAAGVNDKAFAAGVSIYPNPANDLLNISFTDASADNVSVAIYDIQGRLMLSKNVSTLNASSFDISQFATGTYIVNLTGDNINISKKIVKK